MSPQPDIPSVLHQVAAGELSVEVAATLFKPASPFVNTPYREVREQILMSKFASPWLKTATRVLDLDGRDAIDALRDTEILAHLAARRVVAEKANRLTVSEMNNRLELVDSDWETIAVRNSIP